MALITCKDVSFAYEGRTVVSSLSFEVGGGDYLCILGENGSGKSTLMRGILGLKHPSGGQILTGDGLAVNETGYLPQQTAAQKDFPASAYEVVLSGCIGRHGARPFYMRADKAEARGNMERLGISDLRNRCYRELSGGQQQRVLLARALCATRKLLLLDEPAAGLDPTAAASMYSLINKINRESGVTVIMVSHDIQSAVKYASHILHLKSGSTFFGTTAEYVTSGAGAGFTGGTYYD